VVAVPLRRPPRRVTWAEDALDDQFLIRQSINQMRRPPRVTFVDDGQKLLRSVARGPPDLIVLDINMPVLDGLSALRCLREDRKAQHVPVILFSTARNEADVALARELGALDFIQKPGPFDQFAQAVAGILGTRAAASGDDRLPGPADRRSWSPMARARPALRK
jgi:two-component system, response regulator